LREKDAAAGDDETILVGSIFVYVELVEKAIRFAAIIIVISRRRRNHQQQQYRAGEQ
jgi:hypothetical protein